jgi:hypothetical protein
MQETKNSMPPLHLFQLNKTQLLDIHNYISFHKENEVGGFFVLKSNHFNEVWIFLGGQVWEVFFYDNCLIFGYCKYYFELMLFFKLFSLFPALSFFIYVF